MVRTPRIAAHSRLLRSVTGPAREPATDNTPSAVGRTGATYRDPAGLVSQGNLDRQSVPPHSPRRAALIAVVTLHASTIQVPCSGRPAWRAELVVGLPAGIDRQTAPPPGDAVLRCRVSASAAQCLGGRRGERADLRPSVDGPLLTGAPNVFLYTGYQRRESGAVNSAGLRAARQYADGWCGPSSSIRR